MGDGSAVAPELDLLRRRVLNVVGHELRTPVTTLSGLADELERCNDAVIRAELTRAVARNARRLDRLVEDMLLAAKIETLAPVGPDEPIDLMATARRLWGNRGSATFTGSAVALARPAAVDHILSELLDNAIVHGEPPIEIIGTMGSDWAVLEIASGGDELPPQDVMLACEPFYRGERAVTTQAGLGLGLAAARTLARTSAGELTVRARNRGGLIARLELPAT